MFPAWTLAFFVGGVPQPKGSMKGFSVRSKRANRKKIVLVSANPNLAAWEHLIWCKCKSSMAKGVEDVTLPYGGPVAVDLAFYMPRPRSHYAKDGKTLLDSAPRHHTEKPDIDKLQRAVLDAMTLAGVWNDDKQVTKGSQEKGYAGDPKDIGVEVEVRFL